jgi:hypothetical protein
MLEEGNKLKENVWDVKGKPGEMMSYEWHKYRNHQKYYDFKLTSPQYYIM